MPLARAVSRAQNAQNAGAPREEKRARHSAEQALTKMFQLAYDSGASSAARILLTAAALT